MLHFGHSVPRITSEPGGIVTRPYWMNFFISNFLDSLVIDGWGTSSEIALKLLSLDLTDNKSTLVQVMAWCRQATSHYLSQCWLRSMSPYGVTGSQWAITLKQKHNGRHFPDDTFKWIFLNENVWISIKISLKFVPRGPINNIPTLVQTRRQAIIWTNYGLVCWCIYASLDTRPQWVNMFQVQNFENSILVSVIVWK